MSDTSKPGVWVGLKRCGCCVAVTVDREEHRKDVNKAKREWLSDGLSVLYASWEEWCSRYMPAFMECTHEQPELTETTVQP